MKMSEKGKEKSLSFKHLRVQITEVISCNWQWELCLGNTYAKSSFRRSFL